MMFFLAPFSYLYGGITFLRNLTFDVGLRKAYRSSLPVISIGNLTVGGTGKTPLVLYLVEQLKEKGYQPVVLSRGYGGNLRGPHLVSQSDTTADVGDEPLFLHTRGAVPVVVARKRAGGARYIEEHKLGNVIVLDDGFQHRQLARDINILAIYVGTKRAREDFRKGRLLPWGRFREGKSRGLARADVVVFTHRKMKSETKSLSPSERTDLSGSIPSFESFLRCESVTSIASEAELSGQAVMAFCALANPEAFYATLKGAGFVVAKLRSFPDHHHFTQSDLERLETEAGALPLVCTEKDAIKLQNFEMSALYVFKASLVIEDSDRFFELVQERSCASKRKSM